MGCSQDGAFGYQCPGASGSYVALHFDDRIPRWRQDVHGLPPICTGQARQTRRGGRLGGGTGNECHRKQEQIFLHEVSAAWLPKLVRSDQKYGRDQLARNGQRPSLIRHKMVRSYQPLMRLDTGPAMRMWMRPSRPAGMARPLSTTSTYGWAESPTSTVIRRGEMALARFLMVGATQ